MQSAGALFALDHPVQFVGNTLFGLLKACRQEHVNQQPAEGGTEDEGGQNRDDEVVHVELQTA